MGRAGLLVIALGACGRLGFDARSDGGAVDDSLVGDGASGSTADAAVVGGPWSMFSPVPGATDLYTVWGFGQTDVWIGGAGGFIKSFDGTSWITKSGVTVGANMFWASSPTDLWVTSSQCEMKRWDGLSFATITVPGCTNQAFYAVAGRSSTDVWLAGTAGRIDHMTGSLTWTTYPQDSTVDFWAIWPVSATDVYFTGTKGTILHWNGSTFLDESVGTNITIAQIWAANAGDVWAVGGTGAIYHRTAAVPTFNLVPSGVSGALYGLWGNAANDVWAVGDSGVALHWDGVSWTRVATPVTTTLRAVRRVNGNGLRIVGHGGVVLTHP